MSDRCKLSVMHQRGQSRDAAGVEGRYVLSRDALIHKKCRHIASDCVHVYRVDITARFILGKVLSYIKLGELRPL